MKKDIWRHWWPRSRHLFEGKQCVCYVGIKVFRGVIRHLLSCSSICFCVPLVRMYSVRCESNSFVLFIHSAKHLTYGYRSVNHLPFVSNSVHLVKSTSTLTQQLIASLLRGWYQSHRTRHDMFFHQRIIFVS